MNEYDLLELARKQPDTILGMCRSILYSSLASFIVNYKFNITRLELEKKLE